MDINPNVGNTVKDHTSASDHTSAEFLLQVQIALNITLQKKQK